VTTKPLTLPPTQEEFDLLEQQLKQAKEDLATVIALADPMYDFLYGYDGRFIRLEAVGYGEWKQAREKTKEDTNNGRA